ncbi:hypothetical protein JWS13_39095 [Rhodococcus pseudokoreensis]|uniref:Lipoprotein n=1 Tax=Rhodococcus pseudokoreensis TaxID=2811421 RepID=A0A974WA68_9NOCA|nr:hypothetical protein [Rhodococcus pseudokoreensis]QSE94184.1 hypothetical protein JWS13_39095 [Rhodococcus pseudokoreensis]
MLSKRALIGGLVGAFVVAAVAAGVAVMQKQNQRHDELDRLRTSAEAFYSTVRDKGFSAINDVPGPCRPTSESEYDSSLYVWVGGKVGVLGGSVGVTDRAREAHDLLQAGGYTLDFDMKDGFAFVLGPSTDSVVTPSWWYLYEDGWHVGCPENDGW